MISSSCAGLCVALITLTVLYFYDHIVRLPAYRSMLVYGLLSMLLGAMACALASFALVVPAWSSMASLSFTGGSIVLSSPFAAGAWGYCTNISMDTSAGTYFGQCVLYQTNSVMGHGLNDPVTVALTCLCDLHEDSSSYASLQAASSLSPSVFKTFTHGACGANAWLTLALVKLLIALTAVSVLAQLTAVCARRRRHIIAHTTLFHLTVTTLAIVSCVACLSAWAIQSPKGVPYGAAYDWIGFALALTLAVLACGFKFRLEALREVAFSPVPEQTRPSVVKDDDPFGTSQTPYKEDNEPPHTV
ncbi:hypothetical protein ACHHYP_09280 [Achlya hypogyna]|uniref:Transmembrane protein n=1 Tax=Achlya hypogyna TaxID=1202772 RepID=A0A1V9ZJ58_ACHHY|nr:hypothetical protein ACHHYP_09280 [Achlya hypogyna]